MKKFLTVLLVIAVMFTFSFSSAFAGQTVDYKYTEASKVLLTNEAFAAAEGAYGVTEAYKAQLVKDIKALLTDEGTAKTSVTSKSGYTFENVKIGVLSGNYYAPEKTAAKEAIEKAMADVKAATLAKDAYKVYNDLVKKDGTLAVLSKEYINSYYSYDDLAGIHGKTSTLNGMSTYIGRKALSTTGILEGYVRKLELEYYDILDATKFDGTTDVWEQINQADQATLLKWFFDNGYRTKSEIESGFTKLAEALNPFTPAYVETIDKAWLALNSEITAIAKKYNDGQQYAYKNTVTIADLAKMDEILAGIYDFAEKYVDYVTVDEGGYTLTGDFAFDYFNPETGYSFVKALIAAKSLYFNQYYAQLYALPAYARVAETDKTNVIDLYGKVWALFDNYETVLDFLGSTEPTEDLVDGYDNLSKAYAKLAKDDKAALDAITVYYLDNSNAGKDFDKTEKNIANLEKKRTLYDAFVANYGYTYNYNSDLQAMEAVILAAEHNKTTATGYETKQDAIDTSKVQAYLNNATVKVTTKALGKGRVRAQATIDTTSMKYLLDEMTDGCTVSYKFYKNDKGYSWRTVNYTTFKGQKAGKKSYYQCAVEIKDADGKVVATKDYKASTVGVRTAK